jgi:hypothetical protein
MRALHVLLNLDAPLQPSDESGGKKGHSSKAKEASKMAASAAAVPLIQAVLLCDPDGAKVTAGGYGGGVTMDDRA